MSIQGRHWQTIVLEVNGNSQGSCEGIAASVSNKQGAEWRQTDKMGGENEEMESKAICTFPPTALPAL